MKPFAAKVWATWVRFCNLQARMSDVVMGSILVYLLGERKWAAASIVAIFWGGNIAARLHPIPTPTQETL